MASYQSVVIINIIIKFLIGHKAFVSLCTLSHCVLFSLIFVTSVSMPFDRDCGFTRLTEYPWYYYFPEIWSETIYHRFFMLTIVIYNLPYIMLPHTTFPNMNLFSSVTLHYLTLILKIFISDGHIDHNVLEKNLCHSRDSNHRSPVFRSGALTT